LKISAGAAVYNDDVIRTVRIRFMAEGAHCGVEGNLVARRWRDKTFRLRAAFPQADGPALVFDDYPR